MVPPNAGTAHEGHVSQAGAVDADVTFVDVGSDDGLFTPTSTPPTAPNITNTPAPGRAHHQPIGALDDAQAHPTPTPPRSYSIMKYVTLRDLEVSRIGLEAMGMSGLYTGAGTTTASRSARSTGPSTSASLSSTPPTSTAPTSTRSSSAAPSPAVVTRSCSPPSSAPVSYRDAPPGVRSTAARRTSELPWKGRCGGSVPTTSISTTSTGSTPRPRSRTP